MTALHPDRGLALRCAVVVALVLTVGLAACSSSGSSTLSKSEFIKQADAICKKSDAAFQKKVQSYKTEPDDATKVKIVAPYLENEADQLRKLAPPSSNSKTIKAMLDEVQGAADKLRSDKSAINDSSLLEKASKLAKSYGLKQCGN